MNPVTQNDLEAAQLAATQSQAPSSQGADIAAVGRKVKAVYPEYADLSDEQVGLKFITKYGKDEAVMQSLGISTGTGDTKEAANLRKELNNETSKLGFKIMQDAWNRAKNVPDDGSGDLVLIYSLIKALDPNTAVREGEINLSKATGSIPENLITAYKRAKEGKLLSTEQRKEYQSEIARMYNEKAKQQQELNAFYGGLAKDYGLQPEQVTGSVGEVQLAEVPEVTQQKDEGMSGIAGLAANTIGAATDLLIPETKKLPERAMGILEKQAGIQQKYGNTKGDLVKSAQSALDQTLGIAPNVIETAIGPAMEASILKGAPGAIKAVGSKLPQGAGVIKDVVTKGPTGMLKESFGNKRTQAALKAAQEGITINGKEAIKAVGDYVKDVPMAKGVAKEITPTINNAKMAVDETLKKMQRLGDLAYTKSKSGDPKSTAQAQLMDEIYSNLRKQIAEKAPEVSKYQSRLANVNNFEKEFKRYASPLAIGIGGATVAAEAIKKMINGN